jgi:hypothetical protein
MVQVEVEEAIEAEADALPQGEQEEAETGGEVCPSRKTFLVMVIKYGSGY